MRCGILFDDAIGVRVGDLNLNGVVFVMVTLRVRSIVWFATGVALTLLATVLVMQTWRVDAAPGDVDSTFVPVTPCRLFDYRPAPDTVGLRSTSLGAGETHVQQVTGSNGDCTGALAVPVDAVAVAMNVTAVNPTAQSNLRVFPADVATVPTVSNLNFSAGQKPVPNKVDVKLSPDGKIKLFNFAGTVAVIGDVVGYYTNSTLKELAALKMAQPFTESNEILGQIPLSTVEISPTNVISTFITAPVAGTVSVYVSAYTSGGDDPLDRADCMITTGTQLTNPFIFASPMVTGALQSIAGVRSFDMAAGSSKEFKLLCIALGGPHKISDRTMTAIFIPTTG